MNRVRGLFALVASAVVAIALSGCGISIPTDPEGTLDRVTGGTLRVGISHNPPRTDTADPEAMSGVEVDLIEGFAQSIDADVEWHLGTEANLAAGLDAGDLDAAIAGFQDNTPWTSHAGMTRGCLKGVDANGNETTHVILVPMGENDFQVELEEYVCNSEHAQ